MKNKIQHIILLMLLLIGVVNAGYAQEKTRVKIYGNVYGGGELSQVVVKDNVALDEQLVTDSKLNSEEGGLFHKDTEHSYTTYVKLSTGAEIFGKVFGGGQGKEGGDEEVAGLVKGQTDVVLDGANTWERIFGGGEMADVSGNTLVHFKKGKMAHDAYGGGLGKLTANKENNEVLPDNRQTVLASADIKKITGKESTTGNTFVVFDGEDGNHTEYEYKILKKYEENDGVITEYEQTQFDSSRETQLFLTDHNIYGGGMTAANVAGNTYTHINYGMVGKEMLDEPYQDGIKQWDVVYNSIANAQFCVFGGGYGYHAQVNGNTNVTMDVEGSHQFKYLSEFSSSFSQLWDGNTDDPLKIATAADKADWSHGAPGRSCMDIVGGGYNGRVLGSTNITIGGDVVVRKVYGGGYYASVNETNISIKSGLFNRIYGGGLIANVYGKANLTFGQLYDGVNDTDIKTHNGRLLVKDAVYGGNDVSGTVGTSAGIEKTSDSGVKYHVYTPVDDGDHGVRLWIYGGLVLGDVYGAGNGNHTGYTNPAHMQFAQSQHPSENYRKVVEEGYVDISNEHFAHVYKYRPRTGRVEMNLAGNEGVDFGDDTVVDKVRIWGRTFGGGNSCNVGIWNGEDDDNVEVYANDGSSWHPGDNFIGGGTIEINIGSHVQLGNRNDSHTAPNGLFMGSNGQEMVTQSVNPKELEGYHHYLNPRSHSYLPGFLVYDGDGHDIGRMAGLRCFKAFINNILTKSDNVHLNIGEDATDVWMSNFVGGGYRGSMQAATATGKFDYTLPKGVTVGHAVVGGSYNAHIVYRIYAPQGNGYATDPVSGYYRFQTSVPDGWRTDAEVGGTGLGNYLKQYSDNTILRYNFDGGMLAHDSEMNAANTGSRIHQIHDPASLATADFTCAGGYNDNKDNALVHLRLNNRLQPAVHDPEKDGGVTELNVHGGIVYGGCYQSGYVDGDTWVDYDCSLSPLCTDTRFFSKRNTAIYDEVADLNRNNALNVFGAGYGEDTHSMGDVYLAIKSTGIDNGTENGDWPFIYNVFGGSNMGTVGGSTNVYYDGGKQGAMLGSLYGGGYKGDIEGNTYVELVQGFLVNVYGGSRQANIGGAAHVWAYDGSTRPSTGLAPESYSPLIVCNMYGGNDISGIIRGTMPATWTQNTWTDLQGKQFNSYIQVSGTNPGEKGFPLIGNVFGGGNGELWSAGLGAAPNVGTSLLEIDGGTTLRAFGGGNQATITKDAYIFVNTTGSNFADVKFTDYQKGILEEKFFRGVNSGYSWGDNNELIMSNHHIYDIFGGNNIATMAIQPKWNLKSGRIGNVYSGGNMGDMTYYNADAGTSGHESELKGLSIEVNSDDIYIESLYGGCRMSDVKATLYEDDGEGNTTETPQTFAADEYGATVNVLAGHIGNIYGGNDISGYVYNGTNVNLRGSITGNLYGAGNGNYLYAYDKDNTYTADRNVVERWNNNVEKEVYWVKGNNTDSPLQQMLVLNNARPHVAKAYLNIEGTSSAAGEKVYITGSVYCGGNASTIRPATNDDTEAHVKFNIGDNVIVNEVFMGSDGEGLKDASYIEDFVKVNPDINLGHASVTYSDWSSLTDGNTPKGAKDLLSMDEDLRSKLYPSLLSVYMRAVEMKAMPVGFTDAFSGSTFTNTWIGTFCMGGNAGSMMVDEKVEITFPETLKMFSRIIGGSKEASFKYLDIKHEGGFLAPLTGASNTTKMVLNVNNEWYPKCMDMADDNKSRDFLVDNLTSDGKTYSQSGTAWLDCCNIYGGCFRSGTMMGDVEINTTSDLLGHMADNGEEIFNGSTIDNITSEGNRSRFNNAIAFGEVIGNVYGAGYGQESDVQGNTRINILPTGRTNNNDGSTRLYASANNVYGGGRSGSLHGNSYIQIEDGHVFTDVVGGCDVATMYGSTFIGIGYPTYYICRADGEYSLNRSDIWNDDKGVIKKSVWYRAGDFIAPNVWSQMGSTDQANFDLQTPSHSWNQNDDIIIRGGVYGGGYSLANNSSGVAGSYTVKKIDSNYGGNSTIVVADEGGSSNSNMNDHISISTLKAKAVTFTQEQINAGATTMGLFTLADKKYTHLSDGIPNKDITYYDLTGDGGIYGDGHLTFCEGFRAADISGYGYNTASVKHPRLMNTFQRLDLLDINDCCLMLQGAQDFATTEKVNATIYSMTRIGELRMNSTLDAASVLGQISRPSGRGDGDDESSTHQRNYLGFFNNIHYLGSIVTNDKFDDSEHTFHGADGVVGSRSYKAEKTKYITDYTISDKDADALKEFKKRNAGTARNAIGINNGFCLRVQNLDKDGKIYYGPIVGVCEVKLLTLTQGEGGGYVYADNIHADTDNFLNTSGNFVFPGVVNQGNDAEGHPVADQYIVDDCFIDHFGTPANLTTREGELDEAHYWYVEGNKYFYNTTLTGYTFQDALTFELIDNDPNVVLSGMQNGSTLNIKKIEWLSTHRNSYECVLENSETPEKTTDYEFDIEIAGTDNTHPDWKNHMPRHSTLGSSFTTDKRIQNDNLPQLNIKLQDKLDNSGDDNYTNHLDEPELVRIYLEGVTNGQTYEYTITLNIIYLQGPTYEGGVTIENCALPGEKIGFSSGGITIKTPDLMPVTSSSWQILPFKEIDSEGNWKWDNDNGIIIPATMYEEDLDGNINGAVPALYNQNEYNIAYIFTAGGHNFPVLPKQDAALKQNRMVMVHNYHRMKDIVSQHIEESVIAGARVYINNEEDLTKFMEWVNAGNQTAHVDFILQSDIKLTSALPSLTRQFAGTFHGDGYHIDFEGHQHSLFGSKLVGKVYNLGLIGGTSIADDAANVINCYVYANDDDFKYGKKAYELSHAFNPTTDHNDYADYVARYYANGDYQYARHTDTWSLRTEESPNYGNTGTHHLCAHTHDALRWNDVSKINKPLYDGSDDAYHNDYLFFGQHLDKENADAYPVHINPITKVDVDAVTGGNRVYETAGYYQSSIDKKFYYNHDAWALQPSLTAINYTNMTAETDGAKTLPTRFGVDSNKDYGGAYCNETTGHVTQNLLVYNNGENVFKYTDTGDSEESEVNYHNIVASDNPAVFSTDYFHLVDKQDFWCPIQFSVTNRAWYERLPHTWRSIDSAVEYSSGNAWEGIALPFTVKEVMGEEDGNVVSHFYGKVPVDATPATNDRTLHHEYWLTGMVDASEGNAMFARPAVDGDELFTQAQDHGNYVFENTYYKTLTNYIGHYNTREDADWYAQPHTFEDYVFISKNIPYLIAFPGESFYEFNLTDQVMTFEGGAGTQIPESVESSTIIGDISHRASYLHRASLLAVNDEGTAFDDSGDVLPFRTYLATTSSAARRYAINVKDSINIKGNGNGKDYDDEYNDYGMSIYFEGRKLIVKTDIATELPIYRTNGVMEVNLLVKPGITCHTLSPGIYIINGKKFVCL